MSDSLPHVEKSEVIFQESLITLKRDRLLSTHRPPYNYYILQTKPFAVVVLASTEDHKWILNFEYRHPTKKVLLSCPGGFCEENECPLQAAQRELLEETGFSAKQFILMGQAFPYAGISTQETYYVRALQAFPVKQPEHEVAEWIETTTKTNQELDDLISSGIDLDGTLCTALFFNNRNRYY